MFMMRKLLFCACILMVVSVARSQVYIDGQNINADTSVHYIEIVHAAYPWSFVIHWIDTGTKKNGKFTDLVSKKINLNSTVDMIHYMERNGWKMLRRDVIFQAQPDRTFSGTPLSFVLFERTNTAPAH